MRGRTMPGKPQAAGFGVRVLGFISTGPRSPTVGGAMSGVSGTFGEATR
jgi:hypothetical protein